MYSTKELNKNIAPTYLHVGDPYRDAGKQDSNTRYSGKQFQTAPGKEVCDGSGYFSKLSYQSDPFNDTPVYVKTQPLEDRKKGFGSHDASRRDEFMNGIRTEVYREALKKEDKLQKKSLPKDDELQKMMESSHNNEKASPSPQKKQFLYDLGRNKETPFNPKTKRDTYHLRESGSPLALGHHQLSSLSYGEGCDELDMESCKSKFSRLKATDKFLDRSHLGSGTLQ